MVLALNVPVDRLLAIRVVNLFNSVQPDAFIVALKEDTTLDGAIMKSQLGEESGSGKTRAFIYRDGSKLLAYHTGCGETKWR